MNENGTINKVILVGEISHDPYWHKNDNEKAMLCFILTTRERIQQNGKQIEHAEEHFIRVAGKSSETDLKYGQWVHIEGKIKTSFFIDTQSVRRFKAEVMATRIHLLMES